VESQIVVRALWRSLEFCLVEHRASLRCSVADTTTDRSAGFLVVLGADAHCVEVLTHEE